MTGKQTVVPLAGAANRQGRMAADNMLGRKETYHGTQGTAICKIFDLAVASTGKNEKQLKREGVEYQKVYVHTASHASHASCYQGKLQNGYLPGAVNIPVDQLRQRMNELPKDKEIIIYCQVGLRGNVAYRQLVNNGYKARNLLGGYRTYLFVRA